MRTPILGAVIALALWTFVMWAWLYATRIPAMTRHKIVYDPRKPNADFIDAVPPETRWKADNYNHLHEQPTIFYAVAITLSILGAGGGLNAMLAWIYVALRVIHSLVQATVNNVMLRFPIFMIASLVLLWLTINAALIVYSGPTA
jgi:hypothetical protein